ncbi:hypothetical protein V8E51_006496 [Hyaloscypha variabilis]
MTTEGYFPPNYVRLPELTFGVELEIDFATPRDVYSNWLISQPSIPSDEAPQVLPSETPNESDIETPQGPDSETSPTRAGLCRRIEDMRDRIAWFKEESENPNSTPATREAAREALSRAIADAEALVVEFNELSNPSDENQSQASQGSDAQSSPEQAASTSTDSEDEGLRDRLIQYLRAYLNREVADSPPEPALYGQVAYAEPKMAPPTTWHLTYDTSLFPSRRDLAKQLGEELDTVKKTFRCVGAELVSSILNWQEDEVWQPMLRQIEQDLQWDPMKAHGVFFTQEEHLHVHFGMLGSEWELDVAKAVLVLYGLFEHEIERWLRVDLRKSGFCKSLRLGMEIDKVGRDVDGNAALERGARYNPREFAERIYAATTWEELKSEISGFNIGEGLRFKKQDTEGWAADHRLVVRGWTAVGISMARGNKPITLEFRQHQGATDATVISWWVKFLGSLIRYAYSVRRELNLEMRDGQTDPTGAGFLETLQQTKSILDLIAFDKEGKQHFQNLAVRHRNDEFDAKRAMEARVIQERIRRTKLPTGNTTGELMDAAIKQEAWYQAAVAKDPKLDVIPNRVLPSELWPKNPMEVYGYLYLIMPLSHQRTFQEWTSSATLFQRLIELDRTGRILLCERIRCEQEIAAEEAAAAANAEQQAGGDDVEIRTA